MGQSCRSYIGLRGESLTVTFIIPEICASYLEKRVEAFSIGPLFNIRVGSIKANTSNHQIERKLLFGQK
jgi:hypothetical protein